MRPTLVRPLLVGLSLVSGSALLAADAPEVVSEEIAVELVNVDVRAVDSSGRPVAGLPREAFRLLENGEPVEITHFAWIPPGDEAEGRGAATGTRTSAAAGDAAPSAARLVAVLFDDSHLAGRPRGPLLVALREALKSALDAGDRVLLARFDGADVQVVVPSTADRSRIERGIEELAASPLTLLTATMESRLVLEQLDYEIKGATPVNRVASGETGFSKGGQDTCAKVDGMVRAYADLVLPKVEASAGAVLRLANQLTHESGRKVLLHVSDGLPLVAGAEAIQYAYDMCSGFGLVNGIPGAVNTSTADPSGEFQSDRFNPRTASSLTAEYDTSMLWTHVSARVNALGIAIYALQAGPTGTQFFPEAASGMVPPTSRHVARQNPIDTLSLMARDTGGLLLDASTEPDRALSRLLADRGGYYSLAFTPGDATRVGLRRLKVEVDRPGLELRYRRSYRLQSRDEQILGRLAVLFDVATIENPLGITVAARRDPESGAQRLRILVPFDRIDLVETPDGGKSGHLVVYLTLRPEGGRIQAPRQRRLAVTRTDPTAAVHTYDVELPPLESDSDVAVAVLDEYSGATSFARGRLAAR